MTVDKQSLAQSCMCMFHYNVLLHFWQNDPGLFHANAATWEWNGHQNNRQHKKLFREKKICLPILLGIKPIIFRSRVWCSATESNPCWQWCWGQWCNTWSKINPLLAPQAWRIWSYLSMKIQSSSETSHGSRPLFSLYTDHIYYFGYCMLLNEPHVLNYSWRQIYQHCPMYY